MWSYNNVFEKIIKENKEESTIFKEEEIIEKYKNGENRIVTEQARYPLINLNEIFEENYNLKPEYQRKFVWDTVRKSRLIESFIINIPIPPIFLYEIEYSKYEVMDGQQRVNTILDYYNDKFSLSGLEIWKELNGKKYSELPKDIKAGIDRRYLSAIILLKESSKDVFSEQKMKQFVFERLNTGGLRLENQEIRNALYPSKFNDLIIKLSENKIFKKLFDIGEERMKNYEMVLRFFTYKSACYLGISKSTKELLDTYTRIAQKFNSKQVNELKELFENTIKFVYECFGEKAFYNLNRNPEKMFYDALMIASAIYLENHNFKYTKIEKTINDKKISLINENKEFFNGKQTSIKNVQIRVKLILELLEEELRERNNWS
ncbi:DUF262 domain-containing protein [Leptotrichia hofstadii]|jgi:hypothetical protein|uniref:GmrSD restriction endonucleases N-terminal domain-containing protein n=1 Tax=Leptotrichia hofstadii F0254 TaxID=634994 RepID=C9MXB4_9FUSO|nr:DUF262 domain-containing protein [Leptotrichia hofstadii]EEX75130.1 hypothetical protein GCWU000323_01186 [Leptotrichia hofstadii F0254]